ncbi:MAG: hypothetical protein RLY30_1850, partial [Pseudomonadota bacterium]
MHNAALRSTAVDHPPSARSNWAVIRDLLPYLLAYRTRIAVALAALLCAKLATVGVPV